MTREIVWTLVVRLLLIGAGLFSGIVTARFLGPDGRGIFFYWSTVAGVAIQFGNLGLASSNTYYLGRGQARLATLAANSLWVSVLGGGLLGMLAIVVLWLEGHAPAREWRLMWPLLLLVPSGLYFLFATNLLVAAGRIGEYNGFELVNRYLGLSLLLVAAWLWRTPESLLAMLGIAGGVVCLGLAYRLHAIDGSGRSSWALIHQGLGYALRAYIAATLAFLTLRVNTFFLERLADAQTLGVWSVAAQVLDIIILVPSTVALILFPRILRSGEPYALMRLSLQKVSFILAIVCAIAIAAGAWAIPLIFGDRFAGAYAMLVWGVPGTYALGLISILSQYLAARGMPHALVWIWAAGLAVECSLGIILIPGYAGNGAMMAFSAAHLAMLGMVWRLAHHEKLEQSDAG